MLVIAKRPSVRHKKYWPRKLELMWVVVDSDTGRTVYGPTTLATCNRYLIEEEAYPDVPVAPFWKILIDQEGRR